jgi:hypothetical protein
VVAGAGGGGGEQGGGGGEMSNTIAKGSVCRFN